MQSKMKRKMLIRAAVLAVLAVTGMVCSMTFYLNDDVTMRSILSGGYTGTPDGHAVYMKYPLTGFISLLYRFSGQIPWFSLVMTCFFWAAISMVLEQVCQMWPDSMSVMIVSGLLCCALFLPYFIYLHYTVVAAMLGGCALFLVATGAERKAVFLLALCYCVRSQVFFLLLPFLGVIVLWHLAERKYKEQLLFLGALAGSVFLCMIWNGLMYAGEGWQQYKEYNDNRTKLYDYEALLPYELYEEQYQQAGITRQQYRVMEEYVTGLDETVNSEVLGKTAEMSAEVNRPVRYSAEYWIKCLKEYYYHMRYTDVPYNYLLLAGYLLAVVLAIRQRRFLQFFLLVCLGAGRSLIWVYLIWKGRFPERIYVSLYLLEIMALAGIVLMMARCQGAKKHSVIIAAAGCILLTVIVGYQLRDMKERVAEQCERQKLWDALTDYCAGQEENLYLLDVRSMVSYSGKVWEQVPYRENFFLAGGWMSATPLMEKRFSELGAKDGGELLVADGREGKVFYITSVRREADWLEELLRDRYGQVSMEPVDSIEYQGEEIFLVYRFY